MIRALRCLSVKAGESQLAVAAAAMGLMLWLWTSRVGG
jgi:hypothetical protein